MKITKQEYNKYAASQARAKEILTENIGKDTLYYVFAQGSGKNTRNIDCFFEYAEAVRQTGLTFTLGNDAPRGGACGSFLKLSRKIRKTDLNKIKVLSFEEFKIEKLTKEIEMAQRDLRLAQAEILAFKLLTNTRLEKSLSGNFYRLGEKPQSKEVKEGTERVTPSGNLQKFLNGEWQ